MTGRPALRSWVIGSLLIALGATGCAGAPSEPSAGDAPPRAPPPAPGWTPDGGPSGLPGIVAEIGAPESKLFALTVPPSPLDDPRLAAARELVAKGKRIEAARAVEAFATSSAGLAPALLARLHLVAATLRRDGGDPSGAIEAYRRVVETAPGLASSASVEIAALQLEQGKALEALATIEKIDRGDRTSDRWILVDAEVAIRVGDAARGAVILEGFIARVKRPAGWATASLRLATALLAKPGTERAEAAARIARLLVATANGAIVGEAHALEKRALGTLPRDRRAAIAGTPLTEKIEVARAKLRSKDARAAVTLLDRLMKAEGERATGDDACALHRVRGEALGEVKRKAEAADAYGAAIEACRSASDRVEVLYAAAKASARAEGAAEAEARFALIETESPQSRFADDARAARVQAAIGRGDLASASSLAESAVATYPAGDVVFDAPFALILEHMVQGRWDRARALLEASVHDAARERSYPRAGRFDYFLGRARELGGDRAGARAAYADVVRRRSATFYGAQAHARLEEIERGAGALALAEAKKRALRTSPLPDPTAAELASASVRRAIELAVAGDPAAAEAELSGLSARDAPPSPGLRWWLARLVAPSDPIRASGLLRGISEVEASPGETDFEDWLDIGPFGRGLPAWQIAYPRPFGAEVAAASTESGVSEALILSIMREESAFSPIALSRSGARGLLQLMPATARTMARPLSLPHDPEALTRPEINTRLGARFLGQLGQRFPHQPLLAVPSYNAGPLAIDRWCDDRPSLDLDLWVETIPYRETRLYTKRVLASLAAYELLGSGPPGDVFFTPRRACVGAEPSGSDDPGRGGAASPEPSASTR